MDTSTDTKPDRKLSKEKLLILDLKKYHVSVNYEQPSITMGRDLRNRIVINHPKVSRIHARIDMQMDRFILTDQSSNGTHIHPDGGDAVVLKKQARSLHGEGIIYLGKEATPDAPNAIRYQIL